MSILNMVLPGSGGKTYQLGTLSSNKNSIDLTYSQTSNTFTITQVGDGNLIVESSDTSIATVELVSGTTYRVTGVSDGNTVVTVSAAATSNYYTPDVLEIEVSCDLTVPVDSVLNNNSWELISQVSEEGTASNYWSVGDCKAVTLNGTVYNISISNQTFYVYILGFNHNSSVEGTGISFGTFKKALNGNEVALIDSNYGSSTRNSFNIFAKQPPFSTASGWKYSRMRSEILGSTKSTTGEDASSNDATTPKANTLMAALPSDLRAVMKRITKYSMNGDSLSSTKDFLPLLAEYEVFGRKYYANSAEKNNQAQYQYYINGNSKVKYRHSATSTVCNWWTRSLDTYKLYCFISNSGSANETVCSYSYGVAPVFLV